MFMFVFALLLVCLFTSPLFSATLFGVRITRTRRIVIHAASFCIGTSFFVPVGIFIPFVMTLVWKILWHAMNSFGSPLVKIGCLEEPKASYNNGSQMRLFGDGRRFWYQQTATNYISYSIQSPDKNIRNVIQITTSPSMMPSSHDPLLEG